MTEVKLCGMRTLDQARAAVSAGAEYIGFVLAPARRQVTPETACEIASSLDRATTRCVGVFVNPDPEEAGKLARGAGLDIVQLSGEETVEDVQRIGLPVFKVVHVAPGEDPRPRVERFAAVADMVILDTYSPAVPGGTGRAFDWSLATQLAREYPLMLAGGLTPRNVGNAIEIVGPRAVDVSSGIETDGEKDPAKIAAFVRAVREVQR